MKTQVLSPTVHFMHSTAVTVFYIYVLQSEVPLRKKFSPDALHTSLVHPTKIVRVTGLQTFSFCLSPQLKNRHLILCVWRCTVSAFCASSPKICASRTPINGTTDYIYNYAWLHFVYHVQFVWPFQPLRCLKNMMTSPMIASTCTLRLYPFGTFITESLGHQQAVSLSPLQLSYVAALSWEIRKLLLKISSRFFRHDMCCNCARPVARGEVGVKPPPQKTSHKIYSTIVSFMA